MQTFNTPGKTRVVVTNPVDAVDLVAEGFGTTTVELVARGPDAEAIAAETTVTCSEANGISVVAITLPSARTFSRRRGLDVVVTSPAGTDVVVGSSGAERSILSLARGSGDVRLRGTVGDVDVALPSADVTAQVVGGTLGVKTASGDVTAESVGGPVKVRSVSGDVSLNAAGDEVSVTVVSGDIDVTEAKGYLDVTSVSGDVTVVDARAGANVKSTSGDVTVRRAWSGAVRAATVSGDVQIGIPSGRGVSVDARSMSGDLSSEIDLGDERGSGEGDGGVVRVTAHSVSGDIEILRASAASS